MFYPPQENWLLSDGGTIKKSNDSDNQKRYIIGIIENISKRAGDENCLEIAFIGNSITMHPLTDYWWGNWGMAASCKENDYVHRTVSKLAEYVDVDYSQSLFNGWEVTGYDRAEFLSVLNGVLTKDLDIVVLQLGDNIADVSTIENDFEELIRYVHTCSPKADVILIDNVINTSDEVEQARIIACDKTSAKIVHLDDICGNEYYQAELDSEVYGNDGQKHVISHDGVALHPSDKIADRLFSVIIQ